jgi:hypothetical protein
MLKFLKLPTPVELGKSKTNYLPFSALSNNKDYSWEDYDKEVKEKYPVRYFLNKKLPEILRSIKYPFLYTYRYVKYNCFCRYHILDLRQPEDECDSYKWGYSDVRERMLYAVFNLIVFFVEKENDHLYGKIDYLQKSILSSKKDGLLDEVFILQEQADYYRKVLTVYDWWKYTRKFNHSQCHALYEVWFETKDDEDKQKWFDAEREFEKEEQEMFMEACSLREGLWT